MSVNNEIILKNVRLSFPNLFKKAVFDGEETNYNAEFILDKVKNKADIEGLTNIVNQIKTENNKAVIRPDRICVKLIDEEKANWSGYEIGNYYIRGNNRLRILIINRDLTPILEEDRIIYGGCYVNAKVRLWFQNHAKYGKRINCQLQGVQFVADGEPFGHKPATVNDFENLAAQGDESDVLKSIGL